MKHIWLLKAKLINFLVTPPHVNIIREIKKMVKVGNLSQQGPRGRGSDQIPTSYQVFEKCSECPEIYNKHNKNIFFIF